MTKFFSCHNFFVIWICSNAPCGVSNFEVLIVFVVGVLFPGLLPVGCRHPPLLVPGTGRAWGMQLNNVNIVLVIIMDLTTIKRS